MPSKRSYRAAILLVNTLAAACTDSTRTVSPPQAALPTITRGQFVFLDEWADYQAIFVADSNGVKLKRISPQNSIDRDPAVSPDGKKIAISGSIPNGNGSDLYVMNADGTNRIRITTDPDGTGRMAGWSEQPAWSPDGKRIAFVGYSQNELQIFVMNADGTGIKQITHWEASSASPEWSADGKRILFARDMVGWENKGIFEIDVDGSNVRQLTSGYRDRRPTRSPDGSRIAFVRDFQDSRGMSLFVMGSDATDLKRLADGLYWGANPAWSPDGNSIAFGVTSSSKMCDYYDDGVLYPCGNEFKRVGLDGTIDPAWLLPTAAYVVWQR